MGGQESSQPLAREGFSATLHGDTYASNQLRDWGSQNQGCNQKPQSESPTALHEPGARAKQGQYYEDFDDWLGSFEVDIRKQRARRVQTAGPVCVPCNDIVTMPLQDLFSYWYPFCSVVRYFGFTACQLLSRNDSG